MTATAVILPTVSSDVFTVRLHAGDALAWSIGFVLELLRDERTLKASLCARVDDRLPFPREDWWRSFAARYPWARYATYSRNTRHGEKWRTIDLKFSVAETIAAAALAGGRL